MNRIRLETGSEPIPGWRLIELRGRGGFADVWEAKSPDGKRAAIKFMASRNTASSIKEMKIIQAIQKMSHPNILRMERIWTIPEYIVIAMELADGSLLDLLDAYKIEYHTAMDRETVIRYLTPVADGLDYLNRHQHSFDGRTVGFQHSDVKPSNLLLVDDQAKLADFGLCRPTSAMTTHLEKSGTLDFAAPEVHRGLVSDSSDQYSLAVTYYHLRTGEFPFPAYAKGFKREHSYQRPLPNLFGVSKEEAKVLERSLDLEPSRRWPNCQAMMAAMNGVINETVDPASNTPLPNSKYGTVMV